MTTRAEQFHASPWIGALFITGGGSKLIEEQLSTPGASASILDVQVPYAPGALTELLGRAPERACSETTARQLAVAAFERAERLQANEHNFGLGSTASLATNREKKGKHRAFWAIQTRSFSASFSANFNADRAAEELALVELMWNALEHVLLGKELKAGQQMARWDADDEQAALYDTTLNRFCTSKHDGKLLLPGSFNPLHAGHQQMLSVGEQLTGLSGAFELTIRNADKPKLDFLTLNDRITQFNAPLWITNAATYAEKARLFPQATFLLGVDTLERIAQVRFYDHHPERLHDALNTFDQQQTQFIVFGRQAEQYVTLADLELPDELRARCTSVPEESFRMDISSTDLRNVQPVTDR